MRLLRAPDTSLVAHLDECRRVLALPVSASGLHWHPFGVYTVPLAKRSIDGEMWSRRLHVWHPEATPVGEASAYGVHTHTGTGVSHVVAGALHHQLYWFQDGEGPWRRTADGPPTPAALQDHAMEATEAGMTHTFPAHHAHGVSKPPGFAISLFEQRDEPKGAPFTTWQRTDVPEEPLVRVGPVPLDLVRRDARMVVEQALHDAA